MNNKTKISTIAEVLVGAILLVIALTAIPAQAMPMCADPAGHGSLPGIENYLRAN